MMITDADEVTISGITSAYGSYYGLEPGATSTLVFARPIGGSGPHVSLLAVVLRR